jgi:hypothetical protein
MFLLLLFAAAAILGIVFTIRAVIVDGPQRVATRPNQLIR